MGRIDEAVLRHRVEEADQVIVGRMESDLPGSLGEVAVAKVVEWKVGLGAVGKGVAE